MESNIDLLYLLLSQKDEIKDVNINILKTLFLSLDYQILSENEMDKTQNKIENDINSSRLFVNKLFDIIGLFYVFQTKNPDLFINGDNDDIEGIDKLISDEMRQYFVNILINEYDNKYHLLSQKDGKMVLRTLLILQSPNNEEMDKLITDKNRFSFYKGTISSLLTQIIDDKTEINGYKFGQNLQSDTFKNFLKKNKLFISKAFMLNDENVFQAKNLNEWRFERLLNHKKVNLEQWLEDGNVKGPLFEWRAGGIREGAGLHPTLNDIDFEDGLNEDEYKDIYDVENVFDEDNGLLNNNNNDINYKWIILRSVCDILLENNDDKKNERSAIAVFVNNSNNNKEYYQYLCDLFGVKCVVIDSDDLNDTKAICDSIQSVI